jgi:DNA replication initiation complex subunit (GINS family)
LAEFLRKNRAEVLKVSIYEYNEALHIRQEREAAKEDGWQEGLQEGRREGIQQGLQRGAFLERICKVQKKARKGLSAEVIADMLEEELTFVEKIINILEETPESDVEQIYDLINKEK